MHIFKKNKQDNLHSSPAPILQEKLHLKPKTKWKKSKMHEQLKQSLLELLEKLLASQTMHKFKPDGESLLKMVQYLKQAKSSREAASENAGNKPRAAKDESIHA